MDIELTPNMNQSTNSGKKDMKPTVCKKSMFAQNNVCSIDVLCFVLELLVIALKKVIPYIHFLSDLQEKTMSVFVPLTALKRAKCGRLTHF